MHSDDDLDEEFSDDSDFVDDDEDDSDLDFEFDDEVVAQSPPLAQPRMVVSGSGPADVAREMDPAASRSGTDAKGQLRAPGRGGEAEAPRRATTSSSATSFRSTAPRSTRREAGSNRQRPRLCGARSWPTDAGPCRRVPATAWSASSVSTQMSSGWGRPRTAASSCAGAAFTSSSLRCSRLATPATLLASGCAVAV